MKVVAIIQARCGSTRFPEKVFAELAGHPLIWHVVNRLKFSSAIDEIVLATTTNPLDDKLYEWAKDNNVQVYRGSENNVLNRYFEAAKQAHADIVVRITADDPFKEPEIIDQAVNKLLNEGYDYVCNNFPPSYPEGLDVEVMTFKALDESEKKSDSDYEREHVTQYIYHNPKDFKMGNISNAENLSNLRWTIDTDKDFKMAQEVYDALYKNDESIFHMGEILDYLKEHPETAQINSDVKRSAMYQ